MVLSFVAVALLLVGDLLPYVRFGQYKPSVFSLEGRSLPAITVDFLVPTASLLLILIAGLLSDSESPRLRLAAGGGQFAIGIVQTLAFVQLSSSSVTFFGSFQSHFEVWPIFGLVGGLLVILAGVLVLASTRQSIEPSAPRF
jgi:hypothetical protein